ncbi:MAG: hypothetical protein KZQ89_09020 [Candidatus Thiodiazotropha sp. (ex Lucinoma kastoroae)]|nr:hypothetical protein [Candidatus Thiodiazotropha sp. (ex Lucinoma kastoroae)]
MGYTVVKKLRQFNLLKELDGKYVAEHVIRHRFEIDRPTIIQNTWLYTNGHLTKSGDYWRVTA